MDVRAARRFFDGRVGIALGYLCVVLIWGTTWYGVHTQVNGTAPHVAVALRLGTASLVFFAIALARRLPLRLRRDQVLPVLLQGGLYCGLNYVAVYVASQHLTSGVIAVLFSMTVPFNIVAERVMHGTRFTIYVVVAALVGMAGIALVFGGELERALHANNALLGGALALLSAAMVAVGNVIAARLAATDLGGVRQNAYTLAAGTASILLYGAVSGSPWTLEVTPMWLAGYAYLVLAGTVLAFAIYMRILPAIGSVAAAYIVVLSPAVAISVSAMLENLALGPSTLAGVALLLVGQSLLVTSRTRRPPAR
jgi:drug/metabolite transporter (DMT)-like permease